MKPNSGVDIDCVIDSNCPCKLDISIGRDSARYRTDWIWIDPISDNADIQAYPWELPFEDNSVDTVQCRGVLEKLTKDKVPIALREFARILRSGVGTIDICVPDLEYSCRQWLANPNLGPYIDAIFGGIGINEGNRSGFSKSTITSLIHQAGLCISDISREKYNVKSDLVIKAYKSERLSMHSVSLVAVDCVYVDRTVRAMKHCLNLADFHNAFLFCDDTPALPSVITHVPIPKIKSIIEYSNFMIRYLPIYRDMFADHILVVQYDGYIVNIDAWDDNYLQYDYIGAPWSDRAVGNGGFSLRSKRLLNTLFDLKSIMTKSHPEDEVIGRTYRDLLINNGISIAPYEVASRFSVECSPMDNTFGYHGKYIEDQFKISIDFTRIDIEDIYNKVALSPSDINEHVPKLLELAAECGHITEFCTRTLESAVAFIYAEPKVLRLFNTTGQELHTELVNILRLLPIDSQYKNIESTNISIEETDLLFIDVIHTYDQMIMDLTNHAGRVRKYIVLHDTTTFGENGEIHGQKGIWPAIIEFITKNRDWRIKEQLHNCNGLTILEHC